MAVSLSVIFCVAAFALFALLEGRRMTIEDFAKEAESRAGIAARAARAPLAAGDAAAASDLVERYSAPMGENRILDFGVISREGRCLAGMRTSVSGKPACEPDVLELLGHSKEEPRHKWIGGRFLPGGLLVAAPVVYDGEYLGAVTILFSTDHIRKIGLGILIKAIIATLMAVVVITVVVSAAAQKALQPLKRLILRLDKFNRDGTMEKLDFRTGDEVELLALALNTMMENLKAASAELERRGEDADAQRRFSEAVVQNIANGIIVIDRAGVITSMNNAAEVNMGLSQNDVCGKKFSDVLPGWEREDSAEIITSVLETGIPYVNERVRLRAPLMDREAVMNFNIRPIVDKPGIILGAVAVLEFLTDKVLLEDHLLRVNEELQRANVVKSEFLSMVSHELRTPLTLIKMYSAMLAERKIGPLTERQEKAVEVLNRRCGNLSDLIDSLLDLSRVESGRMELHLDSLQIYDPVEDAFTVYRPRAEHKGISLELELEPNLPSVLADRDKVARVLNNLLENALKFTEQGRIGIRICRDGTAPEFICVRISDTGIGIPEEHRDRIFEKFYQVDGTDTRKHGGSGLGLAIARELITLHGGRLWLEESSEGKGSTFCFTLPFFDAEKADRLKLREPDSAAAGVKPVADAQPPASQPFHVPSTVFEPPSILLVDDDRDFLDMMSDMLMEDGFRVYTAADGIAALNELFSDKHIDIVLLDVTMPKVTGYEICAAVKSFDATRGIPVLMLTAAGQSDQISRGYEAGAAGYLVKPFEIDILKRTLIRIIGGEQK